MTLGLEAGVVRLAPRDPAWTAAWADEAARLHAAFATAGVPIVLERGGTLWREHLLFRDALRADATLREAHAALKGELAARRPRDREAYTAGKSDFIRAAVATPLSRIVPAPSPRASCPNPLP